MNELNDQLVDLQTRVEFQEDALEQLNGVVAKQDADIIQLKQQLRLLAKRLDDLSFDHMDNGGELDNERPPHY